MRSERSASAPTSANSPVQVVPTSATSGVVPPAMAVVNLSWALAHGWNSIWRSAPVSSLNAVVTSSKNASASGLVPSMIQTVRVSPEKSVASSPPVPSEPDPPPELHAARPSARTRVPVTATVLRRCMP